MNLEYFKKYSSDRVITSNIINKFLEKNETIKLELENILYKIPEYENVRNIIVSIIFNKKLKHCKTCRKNITFF